jgi:hypothetical protein
LIIENCAIDPFPLKEPHNRWFQNI